MSRKSLHHVTGSCTVRKKIKFIQINGKVGIFLIELRELFDFKDYIA